MLENVVHDVTRVVRLLITPFSRFRTKNDSLIWITKQFKFHLATCQRCLLVLPHGVPAVYKGCHSIHSSITISLPPYRSFFPSRLTPLAASTHRPDSLWAILPRNLSTSRLLPLCPRVLLSSTTLPSESLAPSSPVHHPILLAIMLHLALTLLSLRTGTLLPLFRPKKLAYLTGALEVLK